MFKAAGSLRADAFYILTDGFLCSLGAGIGFSDS